MTSNQSQRLDKLTAAIEPQPTTGDMVDITDMLNAALDEAYGPDPKRTNGKRRRVIVPRYVLVQLDQSWGEPEEEAKP